MAPTPLTPLALLALALLVEKPMHAYEMFQVMELRRHERLVKLRAGSLYHTVDRLVRDELAEVVGTDRGGNRPERTTFRITENGRLALEDALVSMLASPAEEFPAFTVAISEAHNLPPERTIELLQHRLELRRRWIEYADLGIQKLRTRGLARQFWIDLELQHVMISAEIGFIEQLIADLGSGDIDWNDDQTPAAADPGGSAMPGSSDIAHDLSTLRFSDPELHTHFSNDPTKESR